MQCKKPNYRGKQSCLITSKEKDYEHKMIIYHKLSLNIYNYMRQQEPGECSLSDGWADALRHKFENMSILQLKREKLAMVKDLQEINVLLDELIQDQSGSQVKVEDMDKEIEKNRKLRKGLKKTLENFQFMLTGDYSVKADEQIVKLKYQVKTMREQVNKFSRMLSIPMQKDIQICEDLQKQVYSLEKELEQTKAKNRKKREQINQNNDETQKKITSIKNLNKQIEKIKQSEEIQQHADTENKQQYFKAYTQLFEKRERVLSILQRDQKRYSRQFQDKIKAIKQIQNTSIDISNLLRQIQKSLEQKTQELKVAQKSQYSISKKKRNSEVSVFSKRRNRTEQNSQIQILQRQRQIHYKNISRVRQKSSYSFMPKPQFSVRQSSEQLLPKLYKALGKQRFQIQQDCDVKDLLYT